MVNIRRHTAIQCLVKRSTCVFAYVRVGVSCISYDKPQPHRFLLNDSTTWSFWSDFKILLLLLLTDEHLWQIPMKWPKCDFGSLDRKVNEILGRATWGKAIHVSNGRNQFTLHVLNATRLITLCGIVMNKHIYTKQGGKKVDRSNKKCEIAL